MEKKNQNGQNSVATSALERNTKYQQKKNQLINEAIEWQQSNCDTEITEKEWAEKTYYFYIMGKRYGLLREFQENGII